MTRRTSLPTCRSTAQRLRAITLPGVRTILLIMTIFGGLLALIAAVWVAVLSSSERLREHRIARLTDEYQSKLIQHSQAYQAFGNQRAERERTGSGTGTVPPFGGMEEHAHYDQLTDEYRQRIQERMGRDTLQPESDRDVLRKLLRELLWPALLAIGGVFLSTVASAASLYLPPNV
jgi:hypothetical protein